MYERRSVNTAKPFHITRTQSWVGALLGTFSHVAMDAVMHEDMQPLLPFSDANPWLVVSWTQDVYLGCVLAGVLGMLLILIRAALWERPFDRLRTGFSRDCRPVRNAACG
jgi:membrane-bound metal-dependent hydrolase YbcI (DUF457 family)